MGLQRLLVIRHGELHDTDGMTEDGRIDHHSLTPEGWQRAGALVRLLAPRHGDGAFGAPPNAVAASAVGPGSESRRPLQTVMPTVRALRDAGGVRLLDGHGKHDVQAVAAALGEQDGTALLCWEHSRIADIVRAVAGELPGLPEKWPEDRYDLVWVVERDDRGWRWTARPQWLLAGDRDA